MLINPVLDKECRVLSRRRHLYGARSVYLLFLAGLLWIQWQLVIRQAQLAEIAGANWMNMVSRHVTVQVMWFQFLGLQLLGVILLSGSLSEEVQHRRLDGLRCTPLTHRRIVSGKMVSRMLLLLFLLTMSLPVLSILRAWGGISNVYLAHAMAVTGVTCLFAAALSACLSVCLWRPAHVVLGSLVVLVGLYSMQILGIFSDTAQGVLWATNPYLVMEALGAYLANPGFNTPFPPHLYAFYGVMAGSTALLFVLAVAGLSSARTLPGPIHGPQDTRRRVSSIDRRRGVRLVAWLDLRSSRRFWFNHLGTLLGLGIPLGVLFLVGSQFRWQRGILRVRELCIPALYLIVLVRTATTAVHSIGREKEGRSWAGLLLTPLSNRQILHGKLWVTLVANATGWLVLLVTLVIFSWAMSRVGQFMNPSLHKYRLLLAVCQMIGYASFAVGVSLLWAVCLRNSLQALVMSLLSMGLAYGCYRFGLEPVFVWSILPWLNQHGPAWPAIAYVFGFAFGVAGVQCILGIVCLLWTQGRLRILSVA